MAAPLHSQWQILWWYPKETSEEAGRWKSRPCASQEELPKPSGDPTDLPRMKEQPQEVQVLEFDTSGHKWNTSGHQNERWRHHYTVNGRSYDGTLKRLRRRQEDGSQGHVPVKKNCLSPVETPPSYQGWRNNLRKCRYWSLTLEYSWN